MREAAFVDGHGDLRPEHIWLGDPVRIIDCLEFNAQLRACDPFDEIAFLSLECERLGAAWAGEHIRRRMRALRDGPPEELFFFYRCHRATLRARLAIAHLLEPDPRTPEKWPRLARPYLRSRLRTRRGSSGAQNTRDRSARRPSCSRLIASASSGAAGEDLELVARGVRAEAEGGTVSVTTIRSIAGSASTSPARP